MKQLILFFLILGTAYTLQAQTVTTIDFTNPATPTYGTDAMMNVGGVMMLKPGDANGDKQVIYNGGDSDRTTILNLVGPFTPSLIINGYHTEDVNMDGRVIHSGDDNDRVVVLNTVNPFTPSLIVVEQVP